MPPAKKKKTPSKKPAGRGRGHAPAGPPGAPVFSQPKSKGCGTALRDLEKELAEKSLGKPPYTGEAIKGQLSSLALCSTVLRQMIGYAQAKKLLQEPVVTWEPAKLHFSRAADKCAQVMDQLLVESGASVSNSTAVPTIELPSEPTDESSTPSDSSSPAPPSAGAEPATSEAEPSSSTSATQTPTPSSSSSSSTSSSTSSSSSEASSSSASPASSSSSSSPSPATTRGATLTTETASFEEKLEVITELLPAILMELSLATVAWHSAYGPGITVMETQDFTNWFDREGKTHCQLYFSYVPLVLIQNFPQIVKQLPDLVKPPSSHETKDFIRLAIFDQRGFVRGLFLSLVPTYDLCKRFIPPPLKNPTTATIVIDTSTGQWITISLKEKAQ